MINRLAVETLPAGEGEFYRRHRVELERRAEEPDTVLRAREGGAESMRHFLDLDAHMDPPFKGFPRFYDEAVKRFGKRDLHRHGILPWVILRFRRELAEALGRGEERKAVEKAAYLGHYVADAYQPLHLTQNHDGQQTGQDGLHRRFENGLVDDRLAEYRERARRCLPRAERITNPRERLFQEMFDTYARVKPLLDADRVARGNRRTSSDEYDDILARELGTLVEEQIADAAALLGSLWLVASEDARSRLPAKPTRNLDPRPDGR